MAEENFELPPITSTLDKYRKVWRSKKESVKNEIMISLRNPRIDGHIIYAATLLMKKQYSFVLVKAAGNACTRATLIAEILKSRIPNLHQINRIHYDEIEDVYDPLEEGLDRVVVKKNVPILEIILTLDNPIEKLNEGNGQYKLPLEGNKFITINQEVLALGYQKPIDQSKVDPFDINRLGRRGNKARARKAKNARKVKKVKGGPKGDQQGEKGRRGKTVLDQEKVQKFEQFLDKKDKGSRPRTYGNKEERAERREPRQRDERREDRENENKREERKEEYRGGFRSRGGPRSVFRTRGLASRPRGAGRNVESRGGRKYSFDDMNTGNRDRIERPMRREESLERVKRRRASEDDFNLREGGRPIRRGRAGRGFRGNRGVSRGTSRGGRFMVRGRGGARGSGRGGQFIHRGRGRGSDNKQE